MMVLRVYSKGAIAATLETELDYVVSEMMKMTDLDFVQDFKLLTILVGANDLCGGCRSNLFVSSKMCACGGCHVLTGLTLPPGRHNLLALSVARRI